MVVIITERFVGTKRRINGGRRFDYRKIMFPSVPEIVIAAEKGHLGKVVNFR